MLPLGRNCASPITMLFTPLAMYVSELVAVMVDVLSLKARTVDCPPPAPLLNRTKLPSVSMWWPWLTDQVPAPLKNFVMSLGLLPPSCQMSCPVRDTFTYMFGLRSPSVYVLSDG